MLNRALKEILFFVFCAILLIFGSIIIYNLFDMPILNIAWMLFILYLIFSYYSQRKIIWDEHNALVDVLNEKIEKRNELQKKVEQL